MIYFDISKTARARHHSGLTRVARRLAEELGDQVTLVEWPRWDRRVGADDWYFSPEILTEHDRPGIGGWLASRPCRTAALFHDAIPLQHPHITWPHSVERHPAYLKLLAGLDLVLAVSATSREVLEGFWRWQQVPVRAQTDVVTLGSDFDRAPRETGPADPPPTARVLCVGIIEPRKNQGFLLEVCQALWAQGVRFELHLAGRANPHFGAPIVAQIETIRRSYPDIHYHKSAPDRVLSELFRTARALVFPTQAEGCGLPVLEALWRGVPVVCSDLPVLREQAGAGCRRCPLGEMDAWQEALRRLLLDDEHWRELATEARRRALPTWRDTAREILEKLATAQPPARAS